MVVLLSSINIQTETLQFGILLIVQQEIMCPGSNLRKKNQMDRSWNMTETVFVGGPPAKGKSLFMDSCKVNMLVVTAGWLFL